MKYALAIAADKENFTAAYVSIYSFKKHHNDADILFYGDKPDAILEDLEVGYVEIEQDIISTHKIPTYYISSMCVVFKDNYDAYIVAEPDILYTKPINDYVKYAIENKRVLGSTKIVDNKLALDTSLYIVPSNIIHGKIQSTIVRGGGRRNPTPLLIDAYYPILDDSLSYDTLTVQPGMAVYNTDKAIVHYDNLAWQHTPEQDLWTKYGEELIEELSK